MSTIAPDFDLENAMIHAIENYLIEADEDEDNCLGEDELRLQAILDPRNRDLAVRWLIADGFLVSGAVVEGVQMYSVGERSVSAEYAGVEIEP